MFHSCLGTRSYMSRTSKTWCMIAVVVLTGCACCGFFALFSAVSGSYSDLLSIVNIVILSVVFLIICVTGAVHYHEINQATSSGDRVHGVCLSSFSEPACTTRMEDFNETDVCPICLSALVEMGTETRRMTCCSNYIHGQCILKYCLAHVTCHQTLPPCVFCRGTLAVGTAPVSA